MSPEGMSPEDMSPEEMSPEEMSPEEMSPEDRDKLGRRPHHYTIARGDSNIYHSPLTIHHLYSILSHL